MIRFLSDENLNGNLVSGLHLRNPGIDVVRVQDVGLLGSSDEKVLDWAAENGRIILTHDRRTLPDHANRRIVAGESMLGLFVIDDRMRLGQAIDEILLLDSCTEPTEWRERILFLPLR
jgi:Domain of unknown function (DUF5615)